jgi:hypothetical protein
VRMRFRHAYNHVEHGPSTGCTRDWSGSSWSELQFVAGSWSPCLRHVPGAAFICPCSCRDPALQLLRPGGRAAGSPAPPHASSPHHP